MSNGQNFLITYGLHNFVTHALDGGKHTFVIRGMESQKMINHAKSIIIGSYGATTKVKVS